MQANIKDIIIGEFDEQLLSELAAALLAVPLLEVIERVARAALAAKTGPTGVLVFDVVTEVLPPHEVIAVRTGRSAADVIASMKTPSDKYASTCRSALCYLAIGSFNDAFGALRIAASVNDDWARHHHYYGLTHLMCGRDADAKRELERALSVEPYEAARQRVAQALAFVTTRSA